MRKTMIYNLIGLFLTFLFIILGQLLWLFDPVKIGQDIYWIEMVDYVIYIVTILPLIWLCSALLGLISYWRVLDSVAGKLPLKILMVLRVMIACLCLLTMYMIVIDLHQLVWILSFIALTWILVLCVTLLEEWTLKERITWKSLSLSALLILLIIILLFPTPYMVMYPGLTVNMNHYAQIEEGSAKGEIMGVLIFERPAFPIDWLYARWFPQYEFEKRKKTDPSLGEQLQVVRALKLTANQKASAIALKEAGIGRGIITKGIIITRLLEDSPARGKLRAGDRIIAINDTSVASIKEFSHYMDQVAPGSEVRLVLKREEDEIIEAVQTMAHTNDQSKAMLGIQITDDIEVDVPRDIDFQSYLVHEGGPSHGAMLALAIINQLSPHDLTYGNIVGGTGTIELDGSIGPIGGIKQKAFLIERAGADVFFVPASQAEEASQGAQDIQIVPVHHIQDMLAWLEENPKNR